MTDLPENVKIFIGNCDWTFAKKNGLKFGLFLRLVNAPYEVEAALTGACASCPQSAAQQPPVTHHKTKCKAE